jgi:catechol 2,3-dioxygenase-like lactoylglutathione lyase family enzyme
MDRVSSFRGHVRNAPDLQTVGDDGAIVQIYKPEVGRIGDDQPTAEQGSRRWLDTVIGISDSPHRDRHAAADGGTHAAGAVELRPARPVPGSPAAMANELGLRNVAFEVDDLPAAVDRLASHGYGLVGGIGEYEQIWRMAYVRGPEGIIVSLAERIG